MKQKRVVPITFTRMADWRPWMTILLKNDYSTPESESAILLEGKELSEAKLKGKLKWQPDLVSRPIS